MTGGVAHQPRQPYIGAMTHFELTDEEAAVLRRELTDITWNNRFQLSSRVRTLKAILAKLRAEPARPVAARSG